MKDAKVIAEARTERGERVQVWVDEEGVLVCVLNEGKRRTYRMRGVLERAAERALLSFRAEAGA